MDFDQSVGEIEALSGELVQVEIWGPGKDPVLVADFSGGLRRMGDVEFSEEVAATLAHAVAETAVMFIVGDSTFGLLPSRFVRGNQVTYRRGWAEVRTQDAAIRIGPKRPAWSD